MEYQYYIKKCQHQELGSLSTSHKESRGRYLYISKSDQVLSIFPPLSIQNLNDHVYIPVVDLDTKEKVYCNFVYHNDKFHQPSLKNTNFGPKVHHRNEYRLYLNKTLEQNRLAFKKADIVIIRKEELIHENEDLEEIFFLMKVENSGSSFYNHLDNIVQNSPLRGDHAIINAYLDEFECKLHIGDTSSYIDVKIDESLTTNATISDTVSSLFTVNSFRDFVLTGYGNKCAITGMVMQYHSFLNIEAAHIKPKSHGGLFLPSNGIALCRDLHWAFDKGFFTIDKDYRVLIHPKVASNYLMSFDGKKIRLPENDFFKPDQEYLEYHRKNIYGIFLKSGRF